MPTTYPLVDAIAGSYEKHKIARQRHQRCEVHQDLYLLGKLNNGNLPQTTLQSQKLNLWCKPTFPQQPERCHICPIEFTYLIQKSFVEAHAVKPLGWLTVERWIRGFLFILKKFPRLKPYQEAYPNLFNDGQFTPNSPEYKEYINLDTVAQRFSI